MVKDLYESKKFTEAHLYYRHVKATAEVNYFKTSLLNEPSVKQDVYIWKRHKIEMKAISKEHDT